VVQPGVLDADVVPAAPVAEVGLKGLIPVRASGLPWGSLAGIRP